MKFQEIMLVFFVGALGGVIGYLAGARERKTHRLECSVVRIVDSEDDEPTASGSPKLPYSILHHQPKWSSHVVPGIVGKEGEIVYLDPSLAQ